MFDDLGKKLDRVLGKFRQRGVLTEPMIRDGLREVRRILLEADVNFRVTREFLQHVQEQALGEQVVKSVSPGQQVVKIVQGELAKLFGDAPPTLRWASSAPTVIMVVGLQGSGKTTTVAKLARRFAKEGRAPLLAACDLYRPAAVDQLDALGAQIGVPVHKGESGDDSLAVANRAVEVARRSGRSVLIVDTAGRLQIDRPMMDELCHLKADLKPQEILLVADAMTGQEAVTIAEGFDRALGLTGMILTKMDGDARGGAALSIRGVVGKPIKFMGVGERVDDLELVDPERLAGRILQKGDVVGLVERAQQAMDTGTQAKLHEQMVRGRFTLEDFLTAMRQIQKMGPLEQLLKMIPQAPRGIPAGGVDPRRMKHMEAIILSMTPDERLRPEILNGSRRVRIARGSGRPVAEVNRLIKQFKQTQRFMKQVKGMTPF